MRSLLVLAATLAFTGCGPDEASVTGEATGQALLTCTPNTLAGDLIISPTPTTPSTCLASVGGLPTTVPCNKNAASQRWVFGTGLSATSLCNVGSGLCLEAKGVAAGLARPTGAVAQLWSMWKPRHETGALYDPTVCEHFGINGARMGPLVAGSGGLRPPSALVLVVSGAGVALGQGLDSWKQWHPQYVQP